MPLRRTQTGNELMILIALALFMIPSIRYPERYDSASCKQMTELTIMQLMSLLMPASDYKQMLMCTMGGWRSLPAIRELSVKRCCHVIGNTCLPIHIVLQNESSTTS